MSNFIRKITSRKFLTAVAGIVAGLAVAFGLDENDIAQVAGVVTSMVSITAYIFGEAKVDAAASLPINVTISEEQEEKEDSETPE